MQNSLVRGLFRARSSTAAACMELVHVTRIGTLLTKNSATQGRISTSHVHKCVVEKEKNPFGLIECSLIDYFPSKGHVSYCSVNFAAK